MEGKTSKNVNYMSDLDCKNVSVVCSDFGEKKYMQLFIFEPLVVCSLFV